MKHPNPPQLDRLRSSRWSVCSASLTALVALAATFFSSLVADAAPPPPHGVTAANITVIQLGFENPAENVIVTNSYAIGDFRVLASANRGDYDIQIGDDFSDDVANGIVMTSIAQNGRDNFDQFGNEHPLYPGTNFATSHIDYTDTGYFFIPVVLTWPNASSTSIIEYNMNVSAAYFPYDQWVAGYARNPGRTNGGVNELLSGSPGLQFGTHFIDHGGGRATVDLTSLGIDSRTDGILLVLGAKNEDNYGLSQVNVTNGTWALFSKDNGTDGASLEHDPFAFVFVPKTNTLVVSGRFRGDATIEAFSGDAPEFTVTQIETGRYELKIPGRSPAYGVLIISPEGGQTQNRDNIVTYEVNPAGDGWIIESRDLPGTLPVLESPGVEPVASFVFIPGPTPGVAVTPTTGLFTTESGDPAQFSVVLDTQPKEDVTIAISSSNPAEGTPSTTSLTFTPFDWNIPQIVIVTGQNDAGEMDGPVAYTITLSAAESTDPVYNGIDPTDVSVVNLDDDGGFTVNPTAGLTTTEAGGIAQFTIVLNQQPTADVTIALSSSDTTEGTVFPPSVTFNNSDWNVPQTITVTGVNDFVDDGDVAYSVITAPATSGDPFFNGLNPPNVSLTNTDDDTAGVMINLGGSFGLGVPEGGNTNYTVVLTSEPTANVTVTVASGNTTQGGTVAPPTLNFTALNWNNPQAVTVTGVDDILVDGSTSWQITNTVSSTDPSYTMNPIMVEMTTLDNEPTITLPLGDAIYGTGMPAVGIDGGAIINDPHTAVYSGGTLTVSLTANGTADDRIEIRNSGTGPGQIGVSGNTVSYGGAAIGTFTGGTGTTPLVVTFNNATPEAAQALLRNITFRTLNDAVAQNRRTVSVTLAHADGGEGTAMTGIRVGLLRAASFQEGADYGYGVYTGQADTQLREAAPDTPYPTGNPTGLFIDWPDNLNSFHVLLRFDNIFGDGPGQIPTNAVLVAAELFLNVTDSGDASPLHRMLIPWDATNETWNTVGFGIQQDDVESRVAFDSAFGLANGDANTTVGNINFSVLPDLEAWRTGDNNYGWVMPGWPSRTDGTGFSPGESPNVDDRPRLRVLWLPEGTASASFRQGVNGYASARDTRIRQNAPDVESSTVTGVFVDAEVTAGSPNPEQVLLRFDDIIGNGPDQIPSGSTVHAAILDLAAIIGNAMGDGGTIHSVLQPWQDTDTWNSLVDGIMADDIDAVAAPSAVAGNPTLNPNVQAGFLSFELTPDVQAWVSGVRPNYGWAVLPWPGGGDGWGFGTAEQASEVNRPRIRVFYTPGEPSSDITLLPLTRTATTTTIHFTGLAGNTYTVLRSETVDGIYGNIGTAVVQPDGTGTFVDNAPPAGAAFYRISYP